MLFRSKIIQTAKDADIDISDYEIVDVKDDVEAAHEAVKLVHDGKADMYMKGLIDSGFKHFLNYNSPSSLDRGLFFCQFFCQFLLYGVVLYVIIVITEVIL